MKKLILFIITATNLIINSATKVNAPVVKEISWGKVVVQFTDGSEKTFKDVKITPSNAIEWDWGKTGTKHQPGVQIEDVNELLEADEIVLTTGMENMLHIMKKTKKFLQKKNKKIHIKQTEEAVKLFNELAKKGIKVAILIHSTC